MVALTLSLGFDSAALFRAGASGPIPVLDQAGVAAFGAYGIRLLSGTWAGSAFRVRRNSDNDETNIGFLASGDLDIAALTTFLGAASGFYPAWYDQSGLGNDLVQATQSKQPGVVLNAHNGLVGVRFNGISAYFECNPTSSVSLIDLMVFAVRAYQGNPGSGRLISFCNPASGADFSTGVNAYWDSGNSNKFASGSSAKNNGSYEQALWGTAPTTGDWHSSVNYAVNDGTQVYGVSLDNAADVVVSGASPTTAIQTTQLRLGAGQDGGSAQAFGHFDMGELIILPSNQVATPARGIIYDNEAAYWAL